jgi:hypothetical protein
VWAKPVLFAYLADVLEPDSESAPATTSGPVLSDWAPSADGSTLLVVDLPGVRSVRLAEALAQLGFRPVPLFNAVPAATLHDVSGSCCVVEVSPIIDAIRGASFRMLQQLRDLGPEAPAAFLLDAGRRLGPAPRSGDFDNRSVSLPTDFPSATFLQSRGVSRVLLVNDGDRRRIASYQPATDLAHTVLRWQTAGIQILACSLDSRLQATETRSIQVTRPTWFRAFWHNALSTLGLRRNPLGGFGGVLPLPSGG